MRAKTKYPGPADRLELYETLVAAVEGVDRKGAANPYTSRREWFVRSWEWVGTLKPKPTKN